MIKYTLTLLLIFPIFFLQAQDYRISFKGIGETEILDSVLIENITQGESITLSGDDVLFLETTKTALNDLPFADNAIRIYPNPSSGECNVEFFAPASGNVTIELFDITGRKLAFYQNNLSSGSQLFKISDISSGIYSLLIHSSAYNYTGKILGVHITQADAKINYIGNGTYDIEPFKIKSAIITKIMYYYKSDLLRLTGFSGKNRTIIMHVPTKNQTITFPFYSCSDANGNNYPIVKIGNQVWMAENLKTDKYRNGDLIEYVKDDTKWSSMYSGAFCYYYNESNKNDIQGNLYNWPAVKDVRSIAPKGWHVPDNDDWKTLINQLGGANIAGSKLKERGSKYWNIPNIDATNESGFSAYPGGLRDMNGKFDKKGYKGFWWSSTPNKDSIVGICYSVNNESGNLDTSHYNKDSGISVRCVLGDLPELEINEVKSINSYSATCDCKIRSDGNLPILQKGICWSTSPNPTINNFKTINGRGIENFSCKLTNLKEETTYYARAFATNDFGTSYGNNAIIKTTRSGLEIAGYSKDIVLFKHTDGRIFNTLSGDFSTFDRNGANKVTLYNFASNGYSGYNINNAILLPSGTVIVALTAYKQTLKFLRSINPSYTAWELVNEDWNGQMLYRGWTVNPDGTLIAGEYPTHNNILNVRLWKVTNDGKTWQVIHTFNGRQGILSDQKQIFHIHTVAYDKYTGLYWIGTGDKDHESIVWTYDGTSLTLIGEGSQLWRVCSFVFTPDYVLWGTDGIITYENTSKCRMIRFNRLNRTPEIVSDTESTMFNCEEINVDGHKVYLSCGTPNHIYLSNDGKNWENVLNLTLNPNLPNVYSWFYNFVDNGDGRMFGYITGILREDNGQPLTNGGTVILDLK